MLGISTATAQKHVTNVLRRPGAPNRAAALTIGTPILFSSVGHGSALDIAGRGIADAGAMREAITRLVGHRRRAVAT